MTPDDTPMPSALALAHAVACQPNRRLWPRTGCVAWLGLRRCGRACTASTWLCRRCEAVALTRLTPTTRRADRRALNKRGK